MINSVEHLTAKTGEEGSHAFLHNQAPKIYWRNRTFFCRIISTKNQKEII
ncbi:hypothetical protein SAMN04488134_101467 [Amphibacillus marinus]|uniref:Uncharacterized protein n=1 Tax=Amphibacillus marinus TaxID=872970 RepID=A0A1H8HWX2_9BACI|nr:hypothetical protein SAMN04488134_101467 [Amphibacillus marinus]